MPQVAARMASRTGMLAVTPVTDPSKPISIIEDAVVIKQILDHPKHKAKTGGTRALPESRAPPAEMPPGRFD